MKSTPYRDGQNVIRDAHSKAIVYMRRRDPLPWASNRGRSIFSGGFYRSEITTVEGVWTPPTVATNGTSPVPRPAGTVRLIW